MSYSIGEVAIATNIAISTALAAGTEEKVKNLSVEDIPEESRDFKPMSTG